MNCSDRDDKSTSDGDVVRGDSFLMAERIVALIWHNEIGIQVFVPCRFYILKYSVCVHCNLARKGVFSPRILDLMYIYGTQSCNLTRVKTQKCTGTIKLLLKTYLCSCMMWL